MVKNDRKALNFPLFYLPQQGNQKQKRKSGKAQIHSIDLDFPVL